jgi:hypothetical protein
VEEADVIIVCLSSNSVTKEGYVQRELKYALDIALEKPEGTIFVIPLRLDNCDPPRRLRGWHYADYFPESHRDRAYRQLLMSLHNRANTLGIFAKEFESTPEPTKPIPAKKKRDGVIYLTHPHVDPSKAHIQIEMKLAPFSYSLSMVKLDGKEIPSNSLTTGIIGKRVMLFSERAKIGEHQIFISWVGTIPGQLTKKFFAFEGKWITVTLLNEIHLWKSDYTWKIVIDEGDNDRPRRIYVTE